MNITNKQQELRNIVLNERNKADGVEITFYTDPLCCWSWAFEPQWRKLQYEYQDKITIRQVMTGLLPSWKNYSDPVYSVSRPQQMGPVWMEAGVASGMPVNSKIWVEDPPSSSYPACIAVKAMQLQSEIVAVTYLRMLREAVMMNGKNIAKKDTLLQIAESLHNSNPGIMNMGRFEDDLTNDNGLEAFRPDWQEAQNRNISRTPTLIMRSVSRPAIILTGYRPYGVLLEAIRQVNPDIETFAKPISVDAYHRFWGSMTKRELEEVNQMNTY